MSQPATNIVEFTVSELSFALRRTVEENFEHVRVRGEISGFKGAAGSGHCYFTLKDSGACIDAVIWRLDLPAPALQAAGRAGDGGDRQAHDLPEPLALPDRRGEPGAGGRRRPHGAARGAAQEARRPRACSTPAARSPIPYLPRVIGVVTSPTGAVIRDILHRLRDRFPSRVLVWPVRVQGEGAAEEVAAAVRGFNALAAGGRVPRPDLLIVARGGGSIEDLWAFNEEVAVRAVAASRIPVIAAVGHETDWTLIDHAADLRAPTPTGAAEMAVPVRVELLAQARELASRHELGLRRAMEARRRGFAALCRALPSLADLLALPRQKLDHVGGRLGAASRTEVARKRRGLCGHRPTALAGHAGAG